VETTGDTIRVLNHGDLWVNNIMFKYGHEKLEDVVFVDYQMCFYTSPGIDLNYFLNTSPTQEVRMTRRPDLIATYYEALHDHLTALSYQAIPTFDQIEAEVQRKEFYGFIASFAVLPIVLMEKQSDKGSGMDAFLNEESSNSMRDICYGSKKYQEAMKYNLKRFAELGVLN
jgi:Ecdysteroid kinase-like family